MFGRFYSPKLSHKPVHNIKHLVSSSHQIVTQGCTNYQIFSLFQSPKVSHKTVQNIKLLVSSIQQNSHKKLYFISNIWSLPFTTSVTQSCTEYKMFGLFYSPKLSHKVVQYIKYLDSSSQQNCHTKL
jgi:hypothetical protein